MDVVNNIIIPNKNIINLNNNVLDYSKITSLLTNFMVCGIQRIFLEGDYRRYQIIYINFS